MISVVSFISVIEEDDEDVYEFDVDMIGCDTWFIIGSPDGDVAVRVFDDVAASMTQDTLSMGCSMSETSEYKEIRNSRSEMELN